MKVVAIIGRHEFTIYQDMKCLCSPNSMARVIVSIAVGLALGDSAFAQSNVDLALEEFVVHDQGVSSAKTTEASKDEDIEYIVVDLDGDGIDEIFVSRPDLMSDGIWILYRDQLDKDGGILKVGVAELDSNSMRFAERDGVKGYYEYLHAGAGKGTLLFNSIDSEGQLVALWEDEVEPNGKDKELVDSLHLGRFDTAGSKPDIKTAPVAPIRQRFTEKSANSVASRPGKRDRGASESEDGIGDPQYRIAGMPADGAMSDGEYSSSMLWILGFGVLVAACFIYWMMTNVRAKAG